MSARVMLAEVLAALTTCDDAEAWRSAKGLRGGPLLSPDGSGAILRPVAWQATLYPWAHTSPAEALETLHTRALWPFATEGDGVASWHCDFLNDAVIDEPPTISALVAVSSLGASALLRAASLAEDIARAAGHPKARLTFRVMTRAAIEEHHNRTGIAADAHDPATAFSREVAAEMYLGGRPAHVAAPWEAPLGNDATSVVLAWDALYALARHEDGTATGVHLVGIDAGAVTLACEALP